MGYKHVSNFVLIFIFPLSLFIAVDIFSSYTYVKNWIGSKKLKVLGFLYVTKQCQLSIQNAKAMQQWEVPSRCKWSLLSHVRPAIRQECAGVAERGYKGGRVLSRCCDGMVLCSLGLAGTSIFHGCLCRFFRDPLSNITWMIIALLIWMIYPFLACHFLLP